MRCECPELKRCCLCVPLRFGVMGLAWMKILSDILLLLHFLSLICDLSIAGRPPARHLNMLAFTIFWTLVILLLLVDIGFNCLLLRGCYKKDPVTLRLFYRYSLFPLGFNIALVIAYIILDIILIVNSLFVWMLTIYAFIVIFMFCVLSIILHLYMTILVRSEAQKLEGTTRFQFTNASAEAACNVAVRPDSPGSV